MPLAVFKWAVVCALLASTVWLCAHAEDCVVNAASRTLLSWDVADVRTSARSVKIEHVDDTVKAIEAIDTPVAVVSIMGQYRSGKSFMLNQMLPVEAKPNGANPFHVGHTVQPETEEVSVLIIPACASPVQDTAVLVLDSPGLFAPNRAQIFDAQLVAALNLLSSAVVYNSLGVIDRSSIEKLSLAVEAARAMAYLGDAADEASKDISRPHLVFSLQNFHLTLADKDGASITPKQWLESMLSTIDIAHNSTSNFVEQFHEFFASLDVFPLPFPTHSLDDADHLDKLPPSAFTDKYTTAMDNFRRRIYSLAQPKELGGMPMSGRMAANLIRQWTNSMNVPLGSSFKNSAAVLLDHLTATEVTKAVDDYTAAMRKLQFPMSDAELRNHHSEALSAVLVYNDVPAFTSRVKDTAKDKFAVYVGMNEQAMREELNKALKDAQQGMQRVLKELALPAVASDLNAARESALGAWRNRVMELRATSASAVTSYDGDVDRWLKEQFEELDGPNAAATQHTLGAAIPSAVDQLRQRMDEVVMPVAPSVLDDASSAVVSAWKDTHKELLQVSADVETETLSKLRDAVDDVVQAARQRNLKALTAAYDAALATACDTFKTQAAGLTMPASAAAIDDVVSKLQHEWSTASQPLRAMSTEPAAGVDSKLDGFISTEKAALQAAADDEVHRLVTAATEAVLATAGGTLQGMTLPPQEEVDAVGAAANRQFDQETSALTEWPAAVATARESMAKRLDEVMANYGQVNSKRLAAVLNSRLEELLQQTEANCAQLGMLANDDTLAGCQQQAHAAWRDRTASLQAVDPQAVSAFQQQAAARVAQTVDGVKSSLAAQFYRTVAYGLDAVVGATLVMVAVSAVTARRGARRPRATAFACMMGVAAAVALAALCVTRPQAVSLASMQAAFVVVGAVVGPAAMLMFSRSGSGRKSPLLVQ